MPVYTFHRTASHCVALVKLIKFGLCYMFWPELPRLPFNRKYEFFVVMFTSTVCQVHVITFLEFQCLSSYSSESS